MSQLVFIGGALGCLILALKQMLGLAVLVLLRLGLVAPVAASATLEVVVLALSADPTTIREVKGFTALVVDLSSLAC